MMLVRLCESILKELYSTCLIAGKAYYIDKINIDNDICQQIKC